MTLTDRIQVAFGPELPEFGSWNWLAVDLMAALITEFKTVAFYEAIPAAKVVIFFKFLPERELLADVAARSHVVFCPVDVYGSAAEIDADAGCLMLCHRVIVHAPRLARYVRGYAPVVCLEHHVKYVAEIPEARRDDGPVLWISAGRFLMSWKSVLGRGASKSRLLKYERIVPATYGILVLCSKYAHLYVRLQELRIAV